MSKASMNQEEKLNTAVAAMVVGIDRSNVRGVQYEKFLAAAGEMSAKELTDVIEWMQPKGKSWAKVMPYLEKHGVSLDKRLALCNHYWANPALKYSTDPHLLHAVMAETLKPNKKYGDMYTYAPRVINQILDNPTTTVETRALLMKLGGESGRLRLIETREAAQRLGCWADEFETLKTRAATPHVTRRLDYEKLLSQEERKTIAQTHKSRSRPPLKDENIEEAWFTKKERADPFNSRRTRLFPNSMATSWKLSDDEVRVLAQGNTDMVKYGHWFNDMIEPLKKNPYVMANEMQRRIIVDVAEQKMRDNDTKDRSYYMGDLVDRMKGIPEAAAFLQKWTPKKKAWESA